MAKSKFEKTMKIASELLSYCHHFGATEYHLDVLDKDDCAIIVIKASPDDIPDAELDRLRTALSAPRQRDVEQGYWELIGESEDFFELTLLGMLCDDAVVGYEDNVLTITLKRYD